MKKRKLPMHYKTEGWVHLELSKGRSYIFFDSIIQFTKEVIMRPIMLLFLAMCAVVSFLAFRAIDDVGSGFLKQLGINTDDAKEYIWSNVIRASFSHPTTNEMKALAAGDRPAIVRQLVVYAQHYVTSDEFSKKYQEYRIGMKPAPPEKPKSMDELRQEQKTQLHHSIEEMEKTKKTFAADQQKQFDDYIHQMQEQLVAVDDPKNPMFNKEMEEYFKQSYEAQMKEHETKVSEWQNEWPERAAPVIIRSLQNFLDVSKDIDYRAEVFKDAHGKLLFSKTIYENKPAEWKLCYRAGKETIEAARAAARQWLDELKRAQ
jgi:hypothetical protein